MTLAGWIFLAFGWGGACALCAFCVVRTLRAAEHRREEAGPE